MPKGVYDRTPDTDKNSRADEIRRNRRMKPGPIEAEGRKLTLEEGKLDRTEYQYRFVNDKSDRVRQLHARDWDIAPEAAKDDSNGLGTVNSALGGVEEGKPYNMVVMRKHKVLFEDDHTRKMKPLDEMDDAIRRGHTDHKGNELHGKGIYTPGQNSIESRSNR